MVGCRTPHEQMWRGCMYIYHNIELTIIYIITFVKSKHVSSYAIWVLMRVRVWDQNAFTACCAPIQPY